MESVQSETIHSNDKESTTLTSTKLDKTESRKTIKLSKNTSSSSLQESKSTIKSFFSNERDDSMADFEIPEKIVKRTSKIQPIKTVKSSRARRKHPDIRKVFNKRCASPETINQLSEGAQLELALALSKVESSGAKNNIDLKEFEFKCK